MKIQAYCVARPNGSEGAKPSHFVLLWTVSVTKEGAAQAYEDAAAEAENIRVPWALLESHGFKIMPCIIEVSNIELGDRNVELQVYYNKNRNCS